MKTQQKDKRKMLLVLPLLVLPFMALAFYGMGGGSYAHPLSTNHEGINTTLPDASFKTADPKDKLGYYQQADQDSASDNGIKDVADRLGFSGVQEDPQTAEINQKLEALNKEISRPAETPTIRNQHSRKTSGSDMGGDVDRLEALMRNMQQGNADDPELRQLTECLKRYWIYSILSASGSSILKRLPIMGIVYLELFLLLLKKAKRLRRAL